MICPYCDSLVQDVPDNRCCPNCGGPLGEPEKPKYPEPPLGLYERVNGFLEIQERGVRFYKSNREQITDRYIPYEELYSVHFVPAKMYLGFLCVRERSDKTLPLVGTASKATADSTSVIFGYHKNEEFRKIYFFLKAVCECNKLR